MQNSNTTFDFERLKLISRGDRKFEDDLLSSYVDDMETKCRRLAELVSEGNLESVQSLTHSIKGASYSVGAQLVGDEALGIETSARSKDMPRVEERLQRLLNAVSETKNVVSDFL